MERGINERFNRYLRWFFSKKTNFEKVTEDEVIESLELINNRPLKVCNGLTAIESFKLCSD
ncbi:hypothetical protein LSA03_15820 [Pediococcus argentinicus]|nr:hypothetical protein LSA03_15820 [Pediococcus argentinicus]